MSDFKTIARAHEGDCEGCECAAGMARETARVEQVHTWVTTFQATHWAQVYRETIGSSVEPVRRINELEDAVLDLTTLVRHIGQTLSWSTAGQRLNNPPPQIVRCQERLQALHDSIKAEREATPTPDQARRVP